MSLPTLSTDHPPAAGPVNAPATAFPAAVAGASSVLSIVAQPALADTRVEIVLPTAYISMPSMTLWFPTPADALAWLAHCTSEIVADLEARKAVEP